MPGEIERNWDRMARAYEEFTSGPDSYAESIEWPCLRAMLPPLEGARVLDLGCGSGRYAFALEEAGAGSVVGMDISGAMLSLAKEKARRRSSRARFLQGDIRRFQEAAPGPFDLIFSATATHYIDDLPALFAGVAQALDEGGQALFSLMHPVYTAQYPIRHGDELPTDEEWSVRYLDKSERGYVQPWIEYNAEMENFLSTSYHHTFSDYMEAVVGAGLKLDKMAEPAPPPSWRRRMPGRYQAFIETPSYLIMRLVRDQK